MKIVTPEGWYVAFWCGVWVVTMGSLYWIIRLALTHALRAAGK